MLYAIIRIGGKQYLAEEGRVLKVERLDVQEGKELSLDKVLLVVDDDSMALGQPLINGAVVKAKVLEHGKGQKVRGLKYKRGGKRTKFGHRQQYSSIQVESISV